MSEERDRLQAPRAPGMRWWWGLCRLTIRSLGGLFWGFETRGSEHVPRRGGLILAANHQSFLDPPLVTACLTREMSFMARRTLFEIPILGRAIVACNAFPVERSGSDLKGVKIALTRLRKGDALLMFPEGTRTGDGRIGPMKAGIRMIAERAGVPIIPVLIDGAFGVWPKGRRFPGPAGRIGIYFGKPIRLEGSDADFGARLRETILALKPGRTRKE